MPTEIRDPYEILDDQTGWTGLVALLLDIFGRQNDAGDRTRASICPGRERAGGWGKDGNVRMEYWKVGMVQKPKIPFFQAGRRRFDSGRPLQSLKINYLQFGAIQILR